MNLAYYLQRKNNNFDLLRLFMALLVIMHHAFPIAQAPYPSWFPSSIGDSSVAFFFLLSGLVVTNSFVHTQKIIPYLSARFFRIFPALFVVLTLSALVIGPIVTTTPLSDYFKNSEVYDYIRINLSLGAKFYLPGVFESNKITTAVNGSLWTINWEIKSYLYLLLIYGIICRYKKNIASCIILILIISILFGFIDPYIFKRKLYAKPFLSLFFIGALFAINSAFLSINKLTFIASILFFTLTVFMGFSNPKNEFYAIYLISSSLLLMHIAFVPLINKLKLPFDCSYGVYIWAFPIGQVIAFYLPTLSVFNQIILTIMLSLIIGTISWFKIEKPALSFNKKLTAMYLNYLCSKK